MNDTDAQLGRKLIADELETVNEYEAMADHASPEAAEVIRDVADEEIVHAGEGAAIVARADERAESEMKEGYDEAAELMGGRMFAPGEASVIIKSSFADLLGEAFAKKGSREAKTSKYPPKKNWYTQWREEQETPSTMGGNIWRQKELENYPWPKGKAKERKMDMKARYDRKTGLLLPVKSVSRPGGKGVYGTVSGGDPDIQWLRDVVELNPDRFAVRKDDEDNWLSVTDLTTNTEMDARSLAKRLEDMGVDRSYESNFDFPVKDLYKFLDDTGKKDVWAQDVADEQARLDALPENQRVPWETAEINVANRYLDEADPYFAQEYARRHPDKERDPDIRHISSYFTAPGTVIPYLNYMRSPERMNEEKQKAAHRFETVRANEEEEARKAAIMDSDLYLDLVIDKMAEFMDGGMPREQAYAEAQKVALKEAQEQFDAHRDAIRREQADFANRQVQSAENLDAARAVIADANKAGFEQDPALYRDFKDLVTGYDPDNLNTLMFTPAQRDVLGRGLKRFEGMSPEDIKASYPKLARFLDDKGGIDIGRLAPSNESLMEIVDAWGAENGDAKRLGEMLGEKGVRTRNIGAALRDIMSALNVPTKEGAQQKVENAQRLVGKNIVNEQYPVSTPRAQSIRDFAMENKGKSAEEIAGLYNDKFGGSGQTTTKEEVMVLTTPETDKQEVIDSQLKGMADEGRKVRETKEEGRKKKFEEEQQSKGDSPEKHQTSEAPPKLIPGGGIEVKESSNIEKSKSFADMYSESIMKKDSEKGLPSMSNDQLMKDPYRHVWMTENEPVYKDRDLNIKEDHGTGGSVKRAPADDGTSGAYDGKKIAKSFAEMYAEKNGFEKTVGKEIVQERFDQASGKLMHGKLANEEDHQRAIEATDAAADELNEIKASEKE